MTGLCLAARAKANTDTSLSPADDNNNFGASSRFTYRAGPSKVVMESELLLVWQVVTELSEQLAHNQKLASSLQSQASVLKVSSIEFYLPWFVIYLSSRTKQLKRQLVLHCDV